MCVVRPTSHIALPRWAFTSSVCADGALCEKEQCSKRGCTIYFHEMAVKFVKGAIFVYIYKKNFSNTFTAQGIMLHPINLFDASTKCDEKNTSV